jgi:hypothetical protein
VSASWQKPLSARQATGGTGICKAIAGKVNTAFFDFKGKLRLIKLNNSRMGDNGTCWRLGQMQQGQSVLFTARGHVLRSYFPDAAAKGFAGVAEMMAEAARNIGP